MKSYKVLGWFLGFLLAFLFALPALASEVVQAPVYKDDVCWWFRIEEKEFVNVRSYLLHGEYGQCHKGGKVKLFLREKGTKIEITPAPPLLMNLLPETAVADLKMLVLPLKEGGEWPVEYRSERGGWVSGKSKVGSIKNVKVPAGTFRAYEIERSEWTSGRNPVELRSTYFYCQECGRIIKYSYKRMLRGEIEATKEVELIEVEKTER